MPTLPSTTPLTDPPLPPEDATAVPSLVSSGVRQQARRHMALTAALAATPFGLAVSAHVRREGAVEPLLLDSLRGQRVLLVVLGAPPQVKGRPNAILQQRLLTASIAAGRNPSWTVLVSGIGHGARAETPWMRQVLLDEGVDAARILVDEYALRTWDSVVRLDPLRDDFDGLVFVSQRAHAQRALYLARHRQWTATAIPSAGGHRLKQRGREMLSRIRSFVDVRGQMACSLDVDQHPLRRDASQM